jgi:hypothetical protein
MKSILAALALASTFSLPAQADPAADGVRAGFLNLDAARSSSQRNVEKVLPTVCFPPSQLPSWPDAQNRGGTTFTAYWDTFFHEGFSLTLFREPCASDPTQSFLYLRAVPFGQSPFICSSGLAVIQNGLQYAPMISQTSGGFSFCNDLLVPTTFLLTPWIAPYFDVNGPITLAYEGVDGNYYGSIPGYTPPAPTATAVEYYYAAWDFYFESSFPDEIAALDAGAFGGVWKRTGQTFEVWPQSNPGAVPTCRFFSTAFPPKSAHFYTPFAGECAALKINPSWQYEAIAFYIQQGDSDGQCGPGTIPLYRLYNNGMGGAPNHRYTTSTAIRDQMLALGWVPEGNGPNVVFACVPSPI